MIAYKFTIGKKGQLTCYKSDNTLNKYTGEKALNKLNHIMDFSFHSFDAMVKELNPNKKCYSMVFVSNNHVVTFEDINKFQRSADFSIEKILREIITIAKENQLKAQQLQDVIMEQYQIDVRKTKIALLTAFSASLIAINNIPKHNTAKKEVKVVDDLKLIEGSHVNAADFDDVPDEIVIEAETGSLTLNDKYNVVFDENNVASFISDKEWNGEALTSTMGILTNGPAGEFESFYDADCICNVGMDNCVKYMRDLGYDEETYPYYIRDDGVRMFGDYVMVASNNKVLPKGTIIETSLGTAMVVDACGSAEKITNQVDIATNWTKHLELKK